MKMCEYGCGKPAKHQFKNGKWCCSKYVQQCENQKKKIIIKLKKSHEIYKQKYGTKRFQKNKYIYDKPIDTKIDPTICKYCGKKAKFILKNGNGCCAKTSASCPAIRKKNSEKIKELHKKGIMNSKGFDGKQGWRKGLTKDTDKRIKEQAERIKRRYKNGELVDHLLEEHTQKKPNKKYLKQWVKEIMDVFELNIIKFFHHIWTK